MLALFGRFGPHQTQPGSSYSGNRYEILRRRAREMDMSQSLASGQLVVFAQADGGTPLPLEVNGDRIEGEGVTFIQAALPLKRDKLIPPPVPATRPSTGPATQPWDGPPDVTEPPAPTVSDAR
jgi:hypothetical protein